LCLLGPESDFSESGVYATAEGTGILLFVSFMERRVELIADKGISSKIPAEEWQQIVTDLSASIDDKKLSAGLQKALTRCGTLLNEHFPGTEDDINELSDRIVILEE
jgi:putative membrane protein